MYRSNMIKNLVRVTSNRRLGNHATNDWLKKAYTDAVCPLCYSINWSLFPTPIDVKLQNYPEYALAGCVAAGGLGLFHLDFIEQIKEYLFNFAIGKCYLSDGSLLREYVTCYSKNYIVIRGKLGSKYDICPKCGTVGSIPGKAPHYVPKFYLTDSRVYMDSMCLIYLDEELALKLDFSPWPDAELDVIPVSENVVDGVHLPIDP